MKDESTKRSAEFFCGMYGEFYQGLRKEGLSKMWAAIIAFLFIYNLVIVPAQKKSQPVDVLGDILKMSPLTKSH